MLKLWSILQRQLTNSCKFFPPQKSFQGESCWNDRNAAPGYGSSLWQLTGKGENKQIREIKRSLRGSFALGMALEWCSAVPHSPLLLCSCCCTASGECWRRKASVQFSPWTSLKFQLLSAALGVRVQKGSPAQTEAVWESRAAAQLRTQMPQFTSSPFPLIARLKLA